jgi:TPR repeat protein
MAELGRMYERGYGVERNEQRAMARFSQALPGVRAEAEAGDADAQFFLGRMYSLGHAVQADNAQAWAWYRKAADQGHPVAQNNIGAMYKNGNGVGQDYAQAMVWYRKAADQGCSLAQRNVADMYHGGVGVKQDYAQAAYWYQKAAEQGDPMAQIPMGLMFEFGRGIKQDYAQAMVWYRKAADQGHAFAQRRIGGMYEKGLGVPQDENIALSYYGMAAAQGDKDAKEGVARIRAALAFDFQISAEDLIAEFISNSFAAEEKFVGKKIKVNGPVDAVERGSDGNPIVSIKVYRPIDIFRDDPSVLYNRIDSGNRVVCLIKSSEKSKAGKLRKNNNVTVMGICRGVESMNFVVMDDCVIAQ